MVTTEPAVHRSLLEAPRLTVSYSIQRRDKEFSTILFIFSQNKSTDLSTVVCSIGMFLSLTVDYDVLGRFHCWVVNKWTFVFTRYATWHIRDGVGVVILYHHSFFSLYRKDSNYICANLFRPSLQFCFEAEITKQKHCVGLENMMPWSVNLERWWFSASLTQLCAQFTLSPFTPHMSSVSYEWLTDGFHSLFWILKSQKQVHMNGDQIETVTEAGIWFFFKSLYGGHITIYMHF